MVKVSRKSHISQLYMSQFLLLARLPFDISIEAFNQPTDDTESQIKCSDGTRGRDERAVKPIKEEVKTERRNQRGTSRSCKESNASGLENQLMISLTV